MNINLDLYGVFCKVAEMQSITLAAQELFISQPAVSQSIKQIEGQMGCPLFTRTPKGVRLTTEVEVLYGYAKKGVELILLGQTAVGKMTGMEAGFINIGASDMTLEFCLLPYLERFKKEYPNIKITISNAPTSFTLGLLRQGKIDFGAISLPIEQEEGFDIMPVCYIQDVFVAGSRFEYLRGQALSYEDICALPIVCLEKGTSTRRHVDDVLAQWGQKMEPEFELATANLIAQFALRNLAVGCIVRNFAQPLLDRGELFEISLQKPLPKRQLCIAKSKKTVVSVAAQKLIEMIV